MNRNKHLEILRRILLIKYPIVRAVEHLSITGGNNVSFTIIAPIDQLIFDDRQRDDLSTVDESARFPGAEFARARRLEHHRRYLGLNLAALSSENDQPDSMASPFSCHFSQSLLSEYSFASCPSPSYPGASGRSKARAVYVITIQLLHKISKQIRFKAINIGRQVRHAYFSPRSESCARPLIATAFQQRPTSLRDRTHVLQRWNADRSSLFLVFV